MGSVSTDQRPVLSSTSIPTSGLPMMSRAPHVAQQRQPIAADYAFYSRPGPATTLHCGGEVRPLSDRPDAFRVDDLAEVGQAARVTLVVCDPVEKRATVILREIRSDSDPLFTADVEHVFDRLDIVVHVRIGPALQEGRKHRHANKAVALSDKSELLV